jgi:exonuclease SbcC
MKICLIKVHNLASLHGAHKIDLESGPLGAAGLFAITGPTGAGKSTLLDAVCLALYDRMPRLIGARSTAIGHDQEADRLAANSVRSILRRDAASGYAEVEFLAADGLRYRSRWLVHRARNKPGGALQPQKMTVENVSTGQSLGGTKTQLLAQLVTLVGLTFDQFRRSVLLAQGDFAAFLEASPPERAELLERMTGTAIYAQLSQAAFERHKAHKLTVQDLALQVQRLGMASPEEHKELVQRGQLSAQALAEAQVTVDQLRAQQRLLQERSGLLERIAQAEAQHAQARADLQVPWRTQLLQAERIGPARLQAAAQAEARLQAAATEASRTAAELGSRARELERQEATWTQAQPATQAAEHQAEKARQDLERARLLEDRILQLQPRLAALGDQLDQTRRVSGQLGRDRQELESRQGQLQAALTQAEQDQDLAALSRAWPELERDRQDWLRAARALDELGRPERLLPPDELDELDRRTSLAPLLQAWSDQRRLEGLLPELRRTRQRAADAQRRARDELARLQVQHEVSSLNADLQEGLPCPVCGSTEHPEAGRPPPSDDQLRAARRSERDTDQADRVAARELAQAESDLRRALDFLQGRGPDLPELAPPAPGELQQLHRQLSAQRALQDWTRSDRDLQALPEGWRRRLADERWWSGLAARVAGAGQARERLQAARAELQALTTELALQGERDKASAESQDKLEREHAGRSAEIQRLQAERRALVPGPLEQAERDLQARSARRQAELEALRQARDQARAQVDLATQARDLAKRAWSQAREAAEAERTQLQAAMAELGLTELDGQPLESGRVAELRQTLDRLENLEAAAGAVVHERRQRLEALAELPALAPDQLAEAEQALHQATQQHARALAALEQDEQQRSKADRLTQQLGQAEDARRIWATLDATIGSATGNKFRAFAQGLTLDRLLAHANQHLLELAPRYRLVRVPQADLELQVIDQAMADEARSVNSLSGGETFMVSLALALGLSSMSSARTRVESLFIDEGFGSLDRRTLETALATLDALQATGRKVGVISHVQGLGDHIGVQIRVVKDAPGRSRVEVPGA